MKKTASWLPVDLELSQRILLGGKAIGIPGEIRGFHEAWKQFGRLPWRDLFQPAIRLCVEGFVMERSLAEAINISRKFIEVDDGWRWVF